MNVLSLFDGISCAQVALKRNGVKVDNYYASELDKFAIQITQDKHPETIQLGDVTKWGAWDIDWSSIDLVSAGFPCQSWSLAGKQLGDKDERGMLFWVTLDIISFVLQCNPKAKFMLENVKMKKEFEDYITLHTENALGVVHKTLINSALVSAQNRNRFYWTNFEVSQPVDKGLVLADILETGVVDRDKSHCVDANYHKGGNLKSYFEKNRRQLVFTNPASIVGRRLNERGVRDDYNKAVPITQCLQVKHDPSKMQCLTTVQKDTVVSSLPPGRYPIFGAAFNRKSGIGKTLGKAYSLNASDWRGLNRNQTQTAITNGVEYRKLTPIECERLQTVPDFYTLVLDEQGNQLVSNTQRYKALGNGFTVDVIAHIFKAAGL